MKVQFPPIPGQLLVGLALILACGFSATALAQTHGVGLGKVCPVSSKPGDIAYCELEVRNEDGFGDTIEVIEFWDVVDPGGPNEFRHPAVGNLPIIEVSSDDVTCALDPDEPIGLAFPCFLPGDADGPNGSGEYVRVRSEYIVPATATDPLLDQGNVIVRDLCDVEPTGCNPNPQQQQFGAAVSLFFPSIEVTKSGPELAKVGDTVTYTIGFENTTTGTAFPGFSVCTGTDNVLGDLGEFEAGVPRQFDYTIQPGDPNPLDNTATISCGVNDFDNVVSDSDSHSLDTFDPSVTVTKTGPELAKAGDTVTYTVTLTNTSSANTPDLSCTADDSLVGAIAGFDFGDNQYDYTIPADAEGSIDNEVTVICNIDGFDNQVGDDDSHTLDVFSPSVAVTKTGPDVAKAGDTVTYTVTLTNTSSANTPDLSCTADDSLVGAIAGFDFGDNQYDYTIPADAEGPIENEVTVICSIDGFDNQVGDDDSHTLDVFSPSVAVTKTGPDVAKAGDTVSYTVTLTNTSSANTPDLSCTADDSLVGAIAGFGFGDNQYDYTIPADAEGSIDNAVTVICDIDGFDNQVGDDDSHTLDVFSPSVAVTKTGPDVAKAGDTVTYTVTLTNTSSANTPDLNCTADDSLVGAIAGFGFGDNQYDYTIPGDAEGPIENEVTVICNIDGFDNQVGDSDSHLLELISPSVSLSKICQPDPVDVGGTIEWLITVTNTGDAELDCLVNDPDAGIVDSALLLAPGDDETIDASRLVTEADLPLISNTATVMCDVLGFDNQLEASDSADCEVNPLVEEICRTPGFWGTHAGTEHPRSTNLTQMVIDHGGPLQVCGATIDNTDVGNVFSAVEAMCVRIQGVLQRQLARQLTAMALNCIVSGGGADCSGTSVESLFADADAACEADEGNSQLGYYIDRVDCFNNGGQFDEVTEQCEIPEEDNCQLREINEATDIFDGVSPLPGPAGSPRACRDANGNGVKVVPSP